VTAGCGAPARSVTSLAGIDIDSQAVVQGQVSHGSGTAVTTGYARLLNEDGDFVAEVPLGDAGGFTFFAAPGDWTVRVLAPGGVSVDRPVSAGYGRVARLDIVI
jgi:Protein of unknown function (DUF1416)